jgi:uncharacterized membrane protein
MDGETAGAAQMRSVDAGHGVNWWVEGWGMFAKNAALWIVLALIMLIIFLVLAFIPLIGALAGALLAPVFLGSWMLAARKAESGGALEVGDLFLAFKGDKVTPLLVVGGVLLVAAIVIGVLMTVLGLGAVFGAAAGGANGSMGGVFAAMGVGMLAMLIGLVFGVVVGMATWFAPALVVFKNVAPIEAVKQSFNASMKNIVPFLLWSVIYIVAAIIASIPFGLGWIVLIPVLLLTVYLSYKDVFEG